MAVRKSTLPEVNFSDWGDIRYLHLGTEWIQGSMKIDAPFEIELEYVQRMMAWLLFVEGRPIAYLCCTAQGGTLRYDHVGHDPAENALSPGAVLQVEAMRQLFDDRFAWFDFTEGEGQHKRQFATTGTACVDLLLLRPTLANRATVAALGAFDGAAGWAKRTLSHPRLARMMRGIRR